MTDFKLKKTFASLPRTTRGQPIVINGDPKGENYLYSCSSNIYIRNIKDSSVCDVYSEHSKETTVAKYSPSRFYIASGDVAGKVRVWDTVNPEHILKIEHPALGGAVKDIDWSMDNQKLLVVGEGRELYGRVFTFDSGNSVGDITGHCKSINSGSMKQTRPFRLVTGSEDSSSIFYEGPPFKFKCSKTEHTNFVNTVRYMPNGEKYVTGGADGKLHVYDGKTSDYIGEIGEPKAHAGGIYAICFNADSSKLLSVSGDKKAKIWNMADNTLETEFVLGSTVNDMQVGCLWQGDTILTVSLSGFINYLDPSNPSQPARVIKGHSKPLMALAVSQDNSHIYTAGADIRMVSWDVASSECDDYKGKGHTNQVADMKVDGEFLISVGLDDMVLFTPVAAMEFSGQSVKLDSQPRAVDSVNGTAVVASINHLTVLEAPGRKVFTLPTNYEALSVSISSDGTQVAVGSKTSLHMYKLENSTLTETKVEKMEEVMSVKFSPDCAHLALSSRNRVRLYSLSNWEELIGHWGEQHTAKVMDLSWSPDSTRFASSGIDSFVILWTVGKMTGKKPSFRAHMMSHVNKLRWLGTNTLVTVGQDANIKVWDVMDQ